MIVFWLGEETQVADVEYSNWLTHYSRSNQGIWKPFAFGASNPNTTTASKYTFNSFRQPLILVLFIGTTATAASTPIFVFLPDLTV